MNNNKKLLFFVLLSFLVGKFSYSGETIWKEFVINPSKSTFNSLEKSLNKKAKQYSVNEDIQNKLINLIEKRNPLAIDAGFILMPKLDGGNLEVMITSVGNTIPYNPELILKMFKKHKTPYRAMIKILTMVPYTLIEKYDERTSLIEKRIESIGSVDDAHLVTIKDESLDILKSEKKRLNKVQDMIKKMQ